MTLSRLALPAALAAALTLPPTLPGAAPGPLALPVAAASVPTGTPVFSNPLDVDNAWFPIEPGGFKVYVGRDGSDRVTIVEHHLLATRDFEWNSLTIPCRIVEETKFTGGRPVERSRAHFAQADDGSIYYFGDISADFPPPEGDDPEDDPNDTESSGWVVGALGPEDPPDTVPGVGPFLFMPADPEPGDTWKPEDALPVVDETDEVRRTGVRLRVPAGRFQGCLEVLERSGIDPGHETKWYAPGVGLVLGISRGERLALQAGTLVRR